MPKLFCVLGAALALASCATRVITVEQMAGSYQAKLETGSDSIVLHPDGTFAEELTFRNGKKLSNQGKWVIQGAVVSLDGVLAVGPESPRPYGFVPKTNVVMPIAQLWGKVRSFGAEDWALYERQ